MEHMERSDEAREHLGELARPGHDHDRPEPQDGQLRPDEEAIERGDDVDHDDDSDVGRAGELED